MSGDLPKETLQLDRVFPASIAGVLRLAWLEKSGDYNWLLSDTMVGVVQQRLGQFLAGDLLRSNCNELDS